jgi:16S rRNA (adenine1518-N6/adenine1519-N6)-dimethyltransferase
MQKENSNKIHRAKKSLGQNFLKGEFALKKIIEAGEIKIDDVILEIGPGKGALTRKLLATSCQLLAVEKDRELFLMLQDKFSEQIKSGSLVLVHDDILKFNFENHKLSAKSYKLIANIPYNITGAILKKFLTAPNQPTSMVLMVQHEVAKRITTPSPSSERRGGKESLLSISVKAYGEPKMIMKVPARYFSPAPKVDSAIIAIKNISRKNFTSPQPHPNSLLEGEGRSIDEQKFWEIVKTGFAHKRKKLSSNLKNTVLCQGRSLTSLGNKRAEDLTLLDWIMLAKS